jgi:hypothetical protein
MDSRFGIRTNNEILVEFRKVTLAMPEVDVRASIGKGNGEFKTFIRAVYYLLNSIAHQTSLEIREFTLPGPGPC